MAEEVVISNFGGVARCRSLAAERPPGLRFNGPVLEFSTETTDTPVTEAPDTAPPTREERNTSRVFMSLELRKLVDADGKELAEWAPRFVKRLAAIPELKEVASDAQNAGAQVHLVLDSLVYLTSLEAA